MGVQIIGLHGQIGSGKSDAAKRIALLLRGRHLPVYEITFGRKLKESVSTFLGLSLEEIERLKNDPTAVVAVGSYIEPEWVRPSHAIIPFRRFLQLYGDGLREAIGADLWLDVAKPGELHEGVLYIVTDVRYANEAAFVREHGGPVVRIIGPTASPHSDHESERVLECERTIDNSQRGDGFASLDEQLRALLAYCGIYV